MEWIGELKEGDCRCPLKSNRTNRMILIYQLYVAIAQRGLQVPPFPIHHPPHAPPDSIKANDVKVISDFQ